MPVLALSDPTSWRKSLKEQKTSTERKRIVFCKFCESSDKCQSWCQRKEWAWAWGGGGTPCPFLKLLRFKSALPACETSPESVQSTLSSLSFATFACNSRPCSFSLRVSCRQSSTAGCCWTLMDAETLLQRGYAPRCVWFRYSELCLPPWLQRRFRGLTLNTENWYEEEG